MNDLFVFERPDWELLIDSLQPNGSVDAIRLLSALEREEEYTAEDALAALLEKKITLDISSLPKSYGAGDTEKRLRMEEKLAVKADVLSALDGSDPLRIYLEELASIPAQGDERLLLQQHLSGDKAASRKLLNLNLHRAVNNAYAYTARGVLLLDLIQAASIGLWQGILQFSGGDFDTHIDWWIRQSIAETVFMQARQDDVLRGAQQGMEAYRQADRRLLTQLGRNATVEEIALEMGVDADQANLIRDMIQNAAEIEKAKQPPKIDEEEDQQAVEDTAYFQSRQRIAELLSTLSEVEAQILTLRFGLEGDVPATPEAVAEKLCLQTDEVIAMEAAALTKLRNE